MGDPLSPRTLKEKNRKGKNERGSMVQVCGQQGKERGERGRQNLPWPSADRDSRERTRTTRGAGFEMNRLEEEEEEFVSSLLHSKNSSSYKRLNGPCILFL